MTITVDDKGYMSGRTLSMLDQKEYGNWAGRGHDESYIHHFLPFRPPTPLVSLPKFPKLDLGLCNGPFAGDL